MASTSSAGHEPNNEITNASDGISQPSASTSAPSSTPSLFSSCFRWFSFFVSLCSMRSNSMASTSTISHQPDAEITDAFEGIAPSPSTSATSSKPPFDVFINHRGPDVKHTLATTLYNTLNHMRLKVFLDSEELELGEFLPKAIQDAMQSASLHIVIFSEHYAESAWCLAELVFILKTGNPIVPVFYHVQPTDLRWIDKGFYARAFSQHESKGRYTEKLEEWKRALYDVSFYKGQIINIDGDEPMPLKNIVNSVLKIIRNVPLVVAKHPVGLDEAVKDFEMTMLPSAKSPSMVQTVGIVGMGGSGKTTLAKEFYNQRYSSMERSSFLFDVRDAASKSLLHEKQRKLLEDLHVEHVRRFDSMEEGKGILATHLRSVRVLLVLDDVDHVDQLDALLPAKNALGPGSLIVVTTRELEVLTCWGISSIYKMKKMDPSHAEQLFCWHAFLQPSPLDGFEEFVKTLLNACGGLPLSLKVLGGQLYGHSCKDYWKSLLHKLSRVLPGDVKNSLKISYDALDDEEKEIFLDVACFFIKEEKNLAIEVWDGCGWSGVHSWERLVNKCLVELMEGNRIRMHDHLRDLGREIASQQSSHRLWCSQQIINVQNQAKKINNIRGIVATTAGSTSEIYEGVCGLAASSLGLKFFVVEGQYFNKVIGSLVSKNLVWLRCIDSGQRKLPSSPSLKNLRVLELYEYHLEELWEADGDVPEQLRELVVLYCNKFQGFPQSIGSLQHLKKIVLTGGIEVRNLPQGFCLLQSLEHLRLEDCAKLSSLPSSFGDLKNLRHLDLRRCIKLKMLPITFKQLTLLEHLDLTNCSKLSSLPRRFGDLKNLRHLDLSGCNKLRTLPDTFKQLTLLYRLSFQCCSQLSFKSNILKNMKKLQYLSFEECSKLEEIPLDIINQTSLGKLNLYGTGLREIASSIGELSKLRVLKIGGPLLTSLSTSLGNLSSLTRLDIRFSHQLESLPDSLGRLNLLEDLKIFFSGVKSLSKSVGQLINLQTLFIYNCPISELDFGQRCLGKLRSIYLCATKVCRISISEGCCPGLEKLKLSHCQYLKNIRSIGGLANLQTLHLFNCPALEELPSFAKLASLKEFQLSHCYKVGKIEGVEHCSSLEVLIAETRWEVAGIESLEHMERLKTLQLTTNKRSAVQTCIQTLQNWPSEVLLCTRAACDATSLINSFHFPNLSVVDSFATDKFESEKWLRSTSNADAIMLCLVINCGADSSIHFNFKSEMARGSVQGRYLEEYGRSLMDEEGKRVWIGVFTQPSPCLASHEWGIEIRGGHGYADCGVEKGFLATLERQSIAEAVCALLVLLGSN